MIGGRKTRSNKGKKRSAYKPRTKPSKTRSNKGKKRGPYGPRTGKTRSGRVYRTVAKKTVRKT